MTDERKVFRVDLDGSTESDLKYFREKLINSFLANSLLEQDTIASERARRQQELLDDAVVIYKLTQKERL